MKVGELLLTLYQEIIAEWNLEEIGNVIDEVDSTLESSINSRKFKSDDDFLNVCFYVSGRSIVSMKEILHLLAAGYPDGALCIARNVYENMIILSYFESKISEADFSDTIKKYFDDMSVVRHKVLKSYYERLAENEKIKEHEEALIELKSKYGVKKFNDYWWCSKNQFNDIVNEVFDFHDANLNGLTSFLLLLYKKACITLHATCTGNVATLGRHSEANIIDTGPTGDDFNVPLFLSLMSFHVISLITFNQMKIDGDLLMKKISDLANDNLKKFSQTSKID